MPVYVQSTIKPYNGKYKVANAKDIGVGEGDNEKSLDEVLNNLPGGGSEYEIPTFDLVTLGLPTIPSGGSEVSLETDTTEIMAALDNGAVKFTIGLNIGVEVQAEVVMNKVSAEGEYICAYTLDFGGPLILTLMFIEGAIAGNLAEIASGSGGVTSWNDLTDKPFYEEVGTIFESEIQYELADDDGDGVMDMWLPQTYIEDTSDATLEIGKTYTLTWDGVEYECECRSLGGVSGIGNTDFMNGKDNGCPVIIVRDITGAELGAPGWMVMLVYNRDDLTGSGLHTCKIEGGIVKQLDNKYLEPFESIVAEDLLPSVTGITELYEDLGVYVAFSKTTEEMFNRWHGNGDNPITGNVFVEFDGVTYECTPQVLAAMDNTMAVGNCTNFGGTDNGEPFVITIIIDNYTDENNNVIDTYSWAIAALTDTAETEHQYRVYQPYDEPKYLLKKDHLPFDAIAAYIDNYIDEALGGDY